MGRITSLSKQALVFLLVSVLIIRPTYAAVGGWTMSNPIASGASTIYNGAKTVVINGANVVKNGTAKITPTATGVAKVLARGGAGYALSIAVEQLLGAVDWVLDPANNQIVYTQACEATASCPTSQYLYVNPHTDEKFSNPSSACSSIQKYLTKTRSDIKINSFTLLPLPENPIGSRICLFNYDYNGKTYNDWKAGSVIANPNYNPAAEDEKKTLPLDTVASKVIENANAGDASAQVATMAAAADIVKDAETDQAKAAPIVQQLENSAVTATDETATGTQTKNPTNPDVTDLSLEFPAFCGWAPVVCEAAQKVISFPITLTEWWETANTKADEWASSIAQTWTSVKEEYYSEVPENTETELEIPDIEDQSIDSDIAFGGACPAPLSTQINFMGLNQSLEFSFDPVCQIAEFIKPVVISISAFSAALIIAGIRTEDD